MDVLENYLSVEFWLPAIRHAKDGFPVTELIAHYWKISGRILAEQPGFTATFTRDGRTPEKGELWSNPDLAKTLEQIANQGRDGFYKGPVAEQIASFVQRHGGYLTVADLESHKGEWVEPVSTRYRDIEVWQLPPNGQGIAVLELLNIMEGFPVQEWGFGSAKLIHHFIEAKKLVFEDRAREYTDMEFYDVPVAHLISKKYANQLRDLIDPEKAMVRVDTGRSQTDQGDTVYLSVADSAGNMVSLIQSNYRGIGSGVCPPRSRIWTARSRRTVLPAGRPCQPVCSGEETVSHHHPRIRNPGWEAVALLRSDGRGHATTGAGMGPDESHRLWYEPAGSGRRSPGGSCRFFSAHWLHHE